MEVPQGVAALLEESLVVYKGTTDAIGNVGKTTLKCSTIGSASSYPDFDGNQIILTSGSYKGQARDINGATNGDAAGTITVANAFDGQIASGTSFIITGIRTVPAEVAALEAKVDEIPAETGTKTFNATALQSIQDESEDALEGENLDHLLKTNLPTNPATDIAANSALGHTMGTSDMASFDRSTDSLQSIRDSADTGYVNVIKIIGEGGHNYTAQAATAPGDNVSAMGALRYIHGAIGTEYVNGNGVPEIDNIRAHLFKTGGMGGGVATKTLTFANDGAGTIALFTVTGDVVVKIIASCSTLVASGAGANIEVGIPADTDGIIATTLATDIDADEIWHDASPDSQIEALSTMREYIIVNGADIGILLSGQVDTGVITFHCIWTGLNGGTVVST